MPPPAQSTPLPSTEPTCRTRAPPRGLEIDGSLQPHQPCGWRGGARLDRVVGSRWQGWARTCSTDVQVQHTQSRAPLP